MEKSLMNERLQVRRFLEKYGLVELTEGEHEARTQDGNPPGNPPNVSKKKKPSTGKKFRRFNLHTTVTE